MASETVIAERFRRRFGIAPDAIASAPGRVNLIGEHTDYNDGFALPMAIDRRLHVAIARNADNDAAVTVVSEEFDGPPQRGHSDNRRTEKYVAAIVSVLGGERSVPGARILISGGIPMAAGLASSAALEIAVARALCDLAGIAWEPLRIARLAQTAENEHMGVRCGIMDQVASAAGRRGKAMLLDCRSLDLSFVEMPAEVAIVVMDTGVRRTLSDTEYNERRAACEEAVRGLSTAASSVRALRDVTPELLAQAAPTLDPVVLKRAQHVVFESRRPWAFVRALGAGDFAAAGGLMNDSHASLRDLYEVSSTHLDVICEVARAHSGCYGARMTGAGFGGSAVALVRSDVVTEFIGAVQPRYEARTYKKSEFFQVTADEGARLENVN